MKLSKEEKRQRAIRRAQRHVKLGTFPGQKEFNRNEKRKNAIREKALRCLKKGIVP